MWRVVRTVVMWLVALALPLQGFAAATMLPCGPGHQQMAASDAEHEAVDGHGHGSPHDHHAMAAPAAHAIAADGAESLSDLHELGKHKCSACSVCSAGTVLPCARVSFDPPKQTTAFALPERGSRVVFLTDGPERPPRPSLV